VVSARMTLDPGSVVGPVRPELFGSFVEHLGRCVYTGIYEPGHPSADEDGFRTDVLDLVRELGVTTIRYPGGNFVSGYRWEDGVGPRASRPRRLDLAWHSTETNEFGVDEFMRWARKASVEPMMAVNLGTRGITEALDLVEYCNHAGGTELSDRRRTNGAPDPHGVRLWCLGNELDGPWQLGHRTAREYGRLAAETARAMRMIDPGLTLVACGSSGSAMPTFGEWERTVLEEAYDLVDLVSAHAYYQEMDGDLGSFLASPVDVDGFVATVAAAADAVGSARGTTKRIAVSFDEWNVWYQGGAPSQVPTGDDWPVAPRLLEDRYTVADAVVVGGLLVALLRNADRVHAACLAQLVNVIAPIMTEPGGPAWKQTIFHPFSLTATRAGGDVLAARIDVPTYETARYGDVPVVDAVATHDAEAGVVDLFVVNRSTSEPARVEVDVRAFGDLALVEAVTLANADHTRVATPVPDPSVAPRPNRSATIGSGLLSIDVPAVSWSSVRLSTRR